MPISVEAETNLQSHQAQSHPAGTRQPSSKTRIPNNLSQPQKEPHSESPNQKKKHSNAAQSQAEPSSQFTFYTANPKQMYTNSVTKFAFATKTGQSVSNPNKTNQDAWITVPHFCGLKYCHFFAVADGHGQYGREVSSYIK